MGTTMDETGPSHLTVFMEGLVRLVPIRYTRSTHGAHYACAAAEGVRPQG